MGENRFGEAAAFCFALPAGFVAFLAAGLIAAPTPGGREFGFLGPACGLASRALQAGSGWEALATWPALLYLFVTVVLFGGAGMLLSTLSAEVRPGTIAVGLALPVLSLSLLSWALDAGGFRSRPPEGGEQLGYYVTLFTAFVVGAVFVTGLLSSTFVSRIRE